MLKRYGGDEQIHRSDLDGLAAQLRLEFAECPSSIRCQTRFLSFVFLMRAASRFICEAVSGAMEPF